MLQRYRPSDTQSFKTLGHNSKAFRFREETLELSVNDFTLHDLFLVVLESAIEDGLWNGKVGADTAVQFEEIKVRNFDAGSDLRIQHQDFSIKPTDILRAAQHLPHGADKATLFEEVFTVFKNRTIAEDAALKVLEEVTSQLPAATRKDMSDALRKARNQLGIATAAL